MSSGCLTRGVLPGLGIEGEQVARYFSENRESYIPGNDLGKLREFSR